MNPTLCAAASFAAIVLVPLAASGQDLFGYWEDALVPNAPKSIEYYVAPYGSNANSGLDPTLPLQTIESALMRAAIIHTTWAAPVTINVAPGYYAPPAAVPRAWHFPAHGISLEAWPDENGGIPTRATIIGGDPAMFVDSIGQASLPPTVLQGFEFQNCAIAIAIDPTAIGDAAPTAVEVRNNYIHQCSRGVVIRVAEDTSAHHVIEDNDFGDDVPLTGGVAIAETCLGDSSTLIRSNRIQLYEEAISIGNDGDGACKPRIFSNCVQIGERLVTLRNCDSWVVHNTVAFAESFGGVQQVTGVDIVNGFAELHNNILWNPDRPGITAIDLTPTSIVNASPRNLIEDSAGGVTPRFRGGDTHPGTVAVDLHLAAGSPMIAWGINFWTHELNVTTRSTQYAGALVRTDVSVDVDLDGRVFRCAGEATASGLVPLVDTGADEYKPEPELGASGARECRIDLVDLDGSAPTTQDTHGNVLAQPFTPPTTARTWTANLYLSGPATATWFLNVGYGFHDLEHDPNWMAMALNGPIYQNEVMTSLGAGNLLLDPALAYTTLNGTFDPAGRHVISGLVLSNNDVGFCEAELHVQLMTYDPTDGRVAFSNRQRLELNDRP